VDPGAEMRVQVHPGYDFWVADGPDPSPEVASSLEAANQSVAPTERLVDVGAAYWTQMGGREYLRWVLPFDEESALDGLARLHAAGDDTLVEDSRLIGSFRAHGCWCRCGRCLRVQALPRCRRRPRRCTADSRKRWPKPGRWTVPSEPPDRAWRPAR
jgi:hypothetical protein